MSVLPPAPGLRLLPRHPGHVLAEAVGAAVSCPYGPCATLPPLWSNLVHGISSEREGLVHGLALAATHAGRCCHLDCPAAASLQDIALLHQGPSRWNRSRNAA